jgi:hypothetical protein
MRTFAPKRMSAVGRAVLAPIAAGEILQLKDWQDEQVRQAALVIPRKQAMREIADALARQLEDQLRAAIECYLGGPVADPQVLAGRLEVVSDGEDALQAERGVTYGLDGVALLWLGPVQLVEEGGELRGHQQIRHLNPAFKPPAEG